MKPIGKYLVGPICLGISCASGILESVLEDPSYKVTAALPFLNVVGYSMIPILTEEKMRRKADRLRKHEQLERLVTKLDQQVESTPLFVDDVEVALKASIVGYAAGYTIGQLYNLFTK